MSSQAAGALSNAVHWHQRSNAWGVPMATWSGSAGRTSAGPKSAKPSCGSSAVWSEPNCRSGSESMWNRSLIPRLLGIVVRFIVHEAERRHFLLEIADRFDGLIVNRDRAVP